jgi:hypothetical protein
MAKDSARVADAYRRVAAEVEILVPGARMKAFDAAAKPKTTVLDLHEARLDAIEHAFKDADTHELVAASVGAKFRRDRLTVRDARTLFRTVAAAKAKLNNASYSQVNARDTGKTVSVGQAWAVGSIEEFNAKLAQHKWN